MFLGYMIVSNVDLRLNDLGLTHSVKESLFLKKDDVLSYIKSRQ